MMRPDRVEEAMLEQWGIRVITAQTDAPELALDLSLDARPGRSGHRRLR